MNSRLFLAAPAVFALAAAACTAEMGSESTGTTEQASTSCSAEYGQCGGTGWTGATCCVSGTTCQYSNAYYSQCLPPTSGSSGSSSSSSSCPSGSNASVQQAAATAAYSIIRAAASACQGNETGSYGAPCWASGILNSQRYIVNGSTIEFNPSDPLYKYVPNAALAALAVAQLNSSVASFLVQGLQWDQANTNGLAAAVSLPLEALSSFSYPGNPSSPIEVYDSNAGGLGRRLETVTGSAWCGSEDIHFADTSSNESAFAPFNIIPISTMSESGYWPNYKGGNAWPSTPFNGSGGGSNPYLVVALSVNGVSQAINWNSTSWPTQTCTTAACVGTLDVDPIPYTQPAPYYNASGLVGPESNPFTLVLSDVYADPSNEGDWATEVVSGVTHGGTFASATTYFGVTVYGYVQQY